MGDIEAWTFAFAAFGPTVSRKHATVTAWQTLTADGSNPQHLATAFGPSNSYPERLAPMESRSEILLRGNRGLIGVVERS